MCFRGRGQVGGGHHLRKPAVMLGRAGHRGEEIARIMIGESATDQCAGADTECGLQEGLAVHVVRCSTTCVIKSQFMLGRLQYCAERRDVVIARPLHDAALDLAEVVGVEGDVAAFGIALGQPLRHRFGELVARQPCPLPGGAKAIVGHGPMVTYRAQLIAGR